MSSELTASLKAKDLVRATYPERIPSVDENIARETLHSRGEIFLLVSVITPLQYLQTRATLRSI